MGDAVQQALRRRDTIPFMDRRARQRKDQAPPMHPLENPFIWFLIQGAEFLIVLLALRTVFPDHVPFVVGLVIWVAVLVGVGSANYAIRRRFIPR